MKRHRKASQVVRIIVKALLDLTGRQTMNCCCDKRGLINIIWQRQDRRWSPTGATQLIFGARIGAGIVLSTNNVMLPPDIPVIEKAHVYRGQAMIMATA